MTIDALKRASLVTAIALVLAVGSMAAASQTQQDALRQRVQSGDATARIQLAELHRTAGDIPSAIVELEAASAAKVTGADARLAEIYAKLPGRENWARATHFLQLAVATSPNVALSKALGAHAARMAMDHELSQDERLLYARDAVSLLTGPVVAGDADAKWHLGHLLSYGPVSVQQPDKGLPMLLNAADAGHVVAARWVSQLYDRVATTGVVPPGLHVPAVELKPYASEQSLHYLKQAAAAGNPMAIRELANRFERVAAYGNADAGERAARIADYLIAAGPDVAASPIAERQALKVEKTRAATCQTTEALQQELAEARREVSRLRALLPEGTERDPDALNRQALASFARGDYEASLPLFRRAAEQGHAGAMANLSIHYLNGLAVPQDVRQAVELLTRAADRGNLVAAENLGELYENGAGVGRNPALAIRWYWRAEDLGSTKAPDALARLKAGPDR